MWINQGAAPQPNRCFFYPGRDCPGWKPLDICGRIDKIIPAETVASKRDKAMGLIGLGLIAGTIFSVLFPPRKKGKNR
jgi:hypothetical protein